MNDITVSELRLYTINTGEIYRKYTVPTVNRLARKVVNNTYDPSKAVKAWLYVADIGAQLYVKEFCAAGEKWHEMFNKATRISAAAELMGYYQEFLDETAAAMRVDKKNKEVWTLSAIKQRHETVGLYFFTRDTMKFFGDSMKSFRVECEGGKIYIVRVQPMRDRDGRNMGGVGDRRLFNPETGKISSVIREEESSK